MKRVYFSVARSGNTEVALVGFGAVAGCPRWGGGRPATNTLCGRRVGVFLTHNGSVVAGGYPARMRSAGVVVAK